MDIQEQTASEFKRAALDLGKTVTKKASDLTATVFSLSLQLINLLRTMRNSKGADAVGETTLNKMEKSVKNGDFLRTVSVPDEDTAFFKDAMQKENMSYVVLDNAGDDCKSIIYLNSDSQKLENVISLYQSTVGITHEIAPNIFLRHMEEKNIGIIQSLSETEFELFREIAPQENLNYSCYCKDGRMTLLYDLKDKEKIKTALNAVSWDMAGRYADKIEDKLVMKRSMQRELKDAIDGKSNVFVVNAKDSGNYLSVTNEGLSYFKNNNKVVEIAHGDKYFADKVREKFKSIENAVTLSETEFKEPIEERELTAKKRYNIFPDYVAEAIKDSRKYLRDVIEKMSLDDENDNPSQIFDKGISYSGYAEYEKLSDTDRNELKEHIEKFYERRRQIKNKEIPVKDRTLNYIIHEAENKKSAKHSKNEHSFDRQNRKDEEQIL